MRAQEFIIENADQAAVDALLKKHGWSMGRTVNGDLAFTWQGNTYVLYGERMRINWPNGQSVSVVWGHKPDWQGRGNEVSYAQAVQKKYLTFDLPIWQALDRGQINDSQAMQRFKAENERQAREAIAQGVTEGKLNEYRDQLWTWVQSKFPKTQWPEYVQRDFLYAKAKGNQNQKDLEDFLDEIQRDFGRVRWQLEKLPITLDIFTPKTQRMIKEREGGSSNPYQVPKDAERHALQQKMIQQKGVSQEPIIVAKLSNGYDLIEGWHRTIQQLKAFPQGYTGPAWVGYGVTYTSESIKQGVTEGQLSVDVPTEAWLQDKIDYAKSKGRNSFGVPYMGSTTASVRGTPPRVRVMRLASLPGMRNEQSNVRKDDLKWLIDYMDKNKRLPPMGSSPDAEYLPYIMVAYNGEAWVNEGNHRIMAAYRLNWPDMPVEIRYFDGGERVESGPMAPGKI